MGKLHYYRFFLRYLNLIIFKRKTMGLTLEKMAASQGEHPFCLFEDETVSYAEMNRRVNRRANLFRNRGVEQREAVCLLMENNPKYLESVIGIAKLGAVTALINTNLKEASLIHCINVSGATRIIVGGECLASLQTVLPELERITAENIFVDGGKVPEGMSDLPALLAGSDDGNPPPPSINSKAPVLYIYTSGTTGLPKPCRVNHYRWYGAGLVMGFYALRTTKKDVIYCALPLYHSNGILIAFASALITGGTLALTRRFSATRFWEEAKRYGATCFIYIGEVLRYLVNQPPSAADRDHTVERILGNGLRPDIWPALQERFGIQRILEFYASTEGNAVTVNMDNVPGSVGKALLKSSDNTVLVRYDVEKDDYIRGPDGFCLRCEPEEVGEMLGEITTIVPFYGYTSNKDTERKILRDVFKKGDSFFRTGDLLKKDRNGNYYFIDRIGDTYRWKGENVSTQEVQEIISGFGGIALVNVFGVSVPGSEGRAGMAGLQMEEGHPFDGDAFYKYTADKLPAFAVPNFVRLVQEMDITGTFKIRKVDLQAQGFDPSKVEGALYYLDRANNTYSPIDAAVFGKIAGGEIRF